MNKPRRQALLLKLIRSQAVENQEQVVALMHREGLEVTQASISRDIRDLGLVKLDGRYVPADQALASPKSGEKLELEVGLITGVEPVGANMIVVKTRTGAASSVGLVLDRAMSDLTAGTVAGDDTLLVAVRGRSDQGRVVAKLNAWLRQAEKQEMNR